MAAEEISMDLAEAIALVEAAGLRVWVPHAFVDEVRTEARRTGDWTEYRKHRERILAALRADGRILPEPEPVTWEHLPDGRVRVSR